MSSQPVFDPQADRIAELEVALAKAERINRVLMDRVERSIDLQGNAFSLFETAIALESRVRDRTADLERALDELASSNAALAVAKEQADGAERRLRDAIDSINEGFAIFDADDRLILCNETYLGLWPKAAASIVPGLTYDEIIRLIGEAGDSLGARVAPDRWVSDRLALHGVAEGGHIHVLADGRWIQANELRTSEGGIVGVYTDITDVKAADARQRAHDLAQKTAMLQSTLDNIRLGVAVYDSDRQLTAFNGPLLATIGLPEDGLPLITSHSGLVETCARVNGPMGDDRPLEWLPLGSSDVVSQRRHANGRLVEVRRSAMADGGMVMSFEDITVRLAAEEALRETAETLERRVEQRTADIAAVNARLQQEMGERLAAEAAMRGAKTAAEEANLSKTRFLAAASHDLLQPLNAARLFVSAIAERRLATPTRALVRQTGSALDSVEDLLEALLEISKLDAGAIVPQFADFPIAELLGALRAEFAPVARARGLALRIPATALWVRSDMRLVRRILQNLLSNALRYTEQGQVELRCRKHGDRVKIEVIDTGIGIAPEHHAAVFEEFRRLDEGGRDRGRGMGLGLAIVQRAARALDTRIKLRSMPGEGSTFRLSLPLAAPQALAPAARDLPRRRVAAEQNVLVIDNEPAILEGMGAMLGGWGCRVTGVRDAAAALAATESGLRPDLILADYHLDHGLTGDDAVRAIRARLGAEIPAIIITADRMPELREQLLAAGFDYLTKPVKPAQLRALLSRPAG
ncbi:NahK/ErcS family hybrid sensor histidine kinase/response regulator [Sphingomonas sp.]|uniref:hybrid sensor histidine kinase/response regulator n=1 Tax=Sphingomonas sp. TaxID=28214 RepID=UPI000DB137B7|nr:NahK/ErcS family hybrid sensor histidine kinase/response regulator [Sphingomonas sp.]PZU09774.1 MAG: hybrid sensor histidine kinase/response regulator [Sphingomonas sp.]